MVFFKSSKVPLIYVFYTPRGIAVHFWEAVTLGPVSPFIKALRVNRNPGLFPINLLCLSFLWPILKGVYFTKCESLEYVRLSSNDVWILKCLGLHQKLERHSAGCVRGPSISVEVDLQSCRETGTNPRHSVNGQKLLSNNSGMRVESASLHDSSKAGPLRRPCEFTRVTAGSWES